MEQHPARSISNFDVRRVGEAAYRLAGELDFTSADMLERVLDDEPAEHVTLDAGGLEFLDSSGMRVLLKSVVRGRTITLRSPTPTVVRTLRIAGVDRLPGLQILHRSEGQPT